MAIARRGLWVANLYQANEPRRLSVKQKGTKMSRADFIIFLREFREDLSKNPEEWENRTLSDFLEAMARYAEDIQGYYDNMNLKIDADEPTWDNFKTLMIGAKIYE